MFPNADHNRTRAVEPISRPKPQFASYQPPMPAAAPIELADHNLFHKLAVYSGVAWLLVFLGVVPELLAYLLHVNSYVLYIVAPPAILGVFLTGAIPRTMKHPAGKYWVAFVLLMILATPFSTWPGASFRRDMDYIRYSLPLLFVAGGIALNWKEIRFFFYAIALGGMLILLAARLFGSVEAGRVSLDSSGTIGNPNDLAAHLLLVLPFILFVVIDKKLPFLLRFCLVGAIGFGIWTILGTASRGALIGIAVSFLCLLLHASLQQRVIVIIGGVILAVILPGLLPASTLGRLSSLFNEKDAEAVESQDSRAYLFKKSVEYTLQHPLLGVGPDQFSNYEGKMSLNKGVNGNWHATHCAFTQVSSECGIPAMLFFIMGIGSSLATVRKTWKQAKRLGFKEIENACVCYITAMVGFMCAITFLANAYRSYLPIMVGLGIAIGATAARHMAANPIGTAIPTLANIFPNNNAFAGKARPPLNNSFGL